MYIRICQKPLEAPKHLNHFRNQSNYFQTFCCTFFAVHMMLWCKTINTQVHINQSSRFFPWSNVTLVSKYINV